VVCLQELKASDPDFPAAAIEKAGYQAIWRGQKTWNGVAILAREAEPILTRNGLPGDAADTQSRYLEAAVNGILIGCIYLPNGNPQPGPKFDYKLAWFKRLQAHAKRLLAENASVVLAGDYNVVPTPFDIYPKSWDRDALVQPKAGRPIESFSIRAGPMRSARFIPTSRCIRSGTTCEIAGRATRVYASTTCY
jgi:exodeoxyribonuclease-3